MGLKCKSLKLCSGWRSILIIGSILSFLALLALLFLLNFFPITNAYSKQYIKRVLNVFGIVKQSKPSITFTPNTFVVHGIDVSHHNKIIDWNLVRYLSKSTDTLSFVFIKATEGREHIDTLFLYNWEQSKQSNLIRGAYHYFKTNVPADVQAKFFIKTVPLVAGDLPPVIDVEESRFAWNYSLEEEVMKMAKILESHYQVKPIIYISHNYYQLYFEGIEFIEYPFWVARYNNHHRLGSSDFWKFWQHTETGSATGINGAVDVNVYVGKIDDLKAITLK